MVSYMPNRLAPSGCSPQADLTSDYARWRVRLWPPTWRNERARRSLSSLFALEHVSYTRGKTKVLRGIDARIDLEARIAEHLRHEPGVVGGVLERHLRICVVADNERDARRLAGRAKGSVGSRRGDRADGLQEGAAGQWSGHRNLDDGSGRQRLPIISETVTERG